MTRLRRKRISFCRSRRAWKRQSFRFTRCTNDWMSQVRNIRRRSRLSLSSTTIWKRRQKSWSHELRKPTIATSKQKTPKLLYRCLNQEKLSVVNLTSSKTTFISLANPLREAEAKLLSESIQIGSKLPVILTLAPIHTPFCTCRKTWRASIKNSRLVRWTNWISWED